MSAAVDLQTVFGRFVPAHRARAGLTAREGQVCAHIRDCRTAALGVVSEHCGACGYTQAHYASCRDRHCPKCQWRASARWSEREAGNLLPVAYYHVVFTVPSTLNPWVTLHPEAVYGQLFESAWTTLAAFAERRLGGRLGMTAVLHTWGEQLTRHVHLHCLVPGGALDEDGVWHAVKGEYLFPVRALSRRLRGNFVAGLRQRVTAGARCRVASSPGKGEWRHPPSRRHRADRAARARPDPARCALYSPCSCSSAWKMSVTPAPMQRRGSFAPCWHSPSGVHGVACRDSIPRKEVRSAFADGGSVQQTFVRHAAHDEQTLNRYAASNGC